jgi:hypothetical protein
MHTQLKKMWTTSPALMFTCWLMLAAFLFSLAGLAIDHRVITGMPAWMKPAKFAISSAIYAATVAWLLGYVEIWPRTMRNAGRTIAAVLILEVAIIDIQAARGTTSHFNFNTPLDGILFGVMGTAILILWLASIVVMLALFRQRFHDRAWGWTLRLAMLISVIGSGTGGLMTRPTAEQVAERRMGHPVVLNGGHTVGAMDGGPGVPVVGWSRDHGDLRIPHFMGLHAIQLLPLLFWLTRRRSVGMAWTYAASYGALFGILLWQALRGQSILQPDGLTLWAMGIWFAAAGIASLLFHAAPSERAMEAHRA